MFEAYHGVTAAQHQSNFDRLSGHGYRPISLSVYGDPGNARYAAVWVQREGPAWIATHGLDGAGYQSFFDTWTAKGYVPTLISATGSGNDAVFAALFEQGINGAWVARHGLTSGPEANAGTFQNLNKSAKSNKLILRSVAIYGSVGDRRYAAIWHANPAFVKWHVYPSETGASYQTAFNAETSIPSFRPAFTAVSGDGNYCAVFRDDSVGAWSSRHGLTAAQYQAEFDKQTQAGNYPICVQGGGSGNSTRYAAIFAKQAIPSMRHWHVAGAAIPALAGLDHVMQNFMQAQAVRCAQLTVAKYGVVKYARAFTWAEPGYRSTQTTDRFLLASCSKMFLEAAVQSLYDAKRGRRSKHPKLKPNTRVYPLLGFSRPADSRSDKITSQQLLDHRGGYDDTGTGSGFDPTYNMRKIALDMNLGRPVKKLDVAKYMYARPLDFTPGTNDKYSNYGYLLASLVVEKISGMDYFQYLKTYVLQPLNITEVEVCPTQGFPRPVNEVIQDDEGLGLSCLDINSPLQVPNVFGGDGEINEVGVANDGTAASASALALFAHSHAAWGNGGRAAGSVRTGSTPGASTRVQSRGDGLDWAFTLSTRNFAPNTSPGLDDLEPAITKLLDKASIP